MLSCRGSNSSSGVCSMRGRRQFWGRWKALGVDPPGRHCHHLMLFTMRQYLQMRWNYPLLHYVFQ